MAPNSRPPLTSRIRASFEGRRKSFEGTRKLSKSGRTSTTADSNGNGASQEVRSPTAIDSEVNSPLHTNGFITQDPDSIRHTVDQAINGEAFQNAIAANLAKLIKPSIKSALDTIQPVVEAVYSHELLLRKMNQSVEDVLSRMDTNAETAAARRESFIDSTYAAPGTPADGEKSADAVEVAVKSKEIGGHDLDQFRQLMEEQNAKSLATISESIESNTTKIAELTQGVSDLNASIGPTKENIESLKSASEQANTTSSVLQAQLDQLRLDIGQIIEAIGTDLGKNIRAISEKPGAQDADLLSSHTTKLDLISTDLATLKGHADTVEKIDAISSELGALKASVEAGNASNTEGFTNVLAAVGEHATALTEIKEKAPHPDILAALQQSNDSHALHTTTLSELKERSPGSTPAPVVSEGGSIDHSSTLQAIQTDLIALKENIAAGLTTNNDLGAKIDTVLTTIEEHKAGDPGVEILAAVKQSNESHAAHAAALEGLKSNSADVNPELGTQITGIVGKLDEHSAALEEIKVFGGTHTAALEGIKSTASEPAADVGDLTTQIAAIIAKLDTHTAVLNEIKGGSTSTDSTLIDTGDLTAQIGAIVTKLDSHATTLDEIKGLSGAHATALESHGTALEGIRSVAPEAATVDTSDLTTQLSSIVAKLDSHTTALDEIKGLGGSHATALEGIKSISPESPPVVDTSDLSTQITAIVSKLDEHTSALDEIKGFSGSHATALESHGTSLEGIKSLSVSVPAETGSAALESQISAVIATLETHGAALDEIKTHTTTLESHGSALDEIKESTGAHTTALESHGAAIEGIKSIGSVAPVEGGTSALETQIAAIVATLESHGSALDEIKSSTGTHVTALESHGAALDSLKSLNAAPPTEGTDAPGIESQISAIITTLESHGAALDEIKTFGTTHATALDSHGTVLEDIKTRSVESVPTDNGNASVESQMADLVAKLDSHSAALEEIKASTGSHSSVLNEIKLASTTHADALEGIRSPGIPAIPAADSMNLAALEIQIGSIISTLETHSAAWNEIKARSDHTSAAVVPTDSGSESGTPEGPFTTIIETLMLHTNLLNEIKEDVSAEILTALHDIGQTQGNQTNLLTEIREADLDDEILTLLHASGESHASHSYALDKIHAAVLVSNESHTAHATSLDEIKSRSVEPAAPSGEAPDLGDLKEKISSIAEKLEEYSVTLSAIKDAAAASNDSHAAHATSLDEIKSRSVESPPTDGANLGAFETQIGGIVTKLEDHTAVLSAIKDATSASNDSHSAHTTILGEIKDATLASKELHTTHAAPLSELKEATSGFNDNHAATLSEIREATLASKDAHASHTAAFTELKSIQPNATPAPESTDLSALEVHITSILSALEAQNTTLSSIKDGTTTANPEILAAIQQSHDLLTAHGSLLDSIKEGTSHTDILTNISELKSILEDSKADVASHGALVKDLHAETKDSHSNLATAIGALALGGATGAGATALLSKDDESDSAVLDEVKAVRALIETSAASVEQTKEKVTSLTAQIEINHTTITTSISTLSDEVKAEIDASGTGIVESIMALDGDVKAIDISPLAISLEQQGAELKSLSTQLETLDGSIKDNNTHITTLHSGVHLNDTGVEQLKDHVVSRSVPTGEVAKEPMPISEGAWFGSARSGSRSPTLSRVASRGFVEPVLEVVEEEPVEVELPSTEEAVVEPEALVEEMSISKEVSDNLLRTEEVVQARSPNEAPAVVEAAVAEPVPDVDDVQHSTEELVPEVEPVVESQAGTEELEADRDLAKAEEVIEADAMPEEHEFVADADPIPNEEVKVDTSTGPKPTDDVVVDQEPELQPTGEVVEDESTPVAHEIKPDDTPDLEPILEELPAADDVVVDREHLEETPDPVLEETKADSLSDEHLISGDAIIETELTPVEPEPLVDAKMDDVDLQASSEHAVEESVPEKSIEEDSQPHANESIETEFKLDEHVVETPTKEIAEDILLEQRHADEQVPKEIDEPEIEEPVVAETQVETESTPIEDAVKTTELAESEPIVEEPSVVNVPVVETPLAEDLDASEVKVDESAVEQPAVIEAPPLQQESASVDEPIATSESVELAEGTTVHEREIQSGDDSVPGVATSELGEEQPSSMLDTAEDLPTPKTLEPLESIDSMDLKSEGQVSRPTSPIEHSKGIDSPSSPLPSLKTAGAEPFDTEASKPAPLEYDEDLASPDANWPLPTHETVQPSSQLIESPTIAPGLDPHAGSPVDQASFLPSAQQNLLGDQGLDSGHATPLDDARSNPFEDSDNLMSPSSVLSPEAEIDAPASPARERMESIDESCFRSPESDTFAPLPTFPVFPGTGQHAAQQPVDDSDDTMSPASGYDAHGLPHMTQESPIQSRQFETSYDPSSPQFEHDSAFQPRGLQRESSFDYQQENYEPAMLPRNTAGQSHERRSEDDDFRSPHDNRFASQDVGRRSPLQPLDDDDYRAAQYERYSPEPEFSDLRQRSPVDSPRFDDSHATLPPHLQLDPALPAPRQRSPIQPFEDDDFSSPHQQRDSPEPESSPFIQRQQSPSTPPPSHGTLPPHLQLDTPAFRSTSLIDPYSERDSEMVSPSSEFAVPITPGMSAKPASSSAAPADVLRSPESEIEEPTLPTQSQKGKAIASPALISPDLGSPAEFGFSREETETEPESTLASPISPVFSEGGTMVEKSGGGGGKKKKGKKEKKEKAAGGKKGKKEKVPFELEGEDAE